MPHIYSSLSLPQLQHHAHQLQQSPYCAAAASPASHPLQSRTQPPHTLNPQPLDCSSLLQYKNALLSTFHSTHCQSAKVMLP